MQELAKRWSLTLMGFLFLLAAVPAGAAAEPAEPTLGNSPINSLNGGRMAEDEGVLYWTGDDGIYAGDTRLVSQVGENLNVIGGGLYYTPEGEADKIYRYDLASGETETVLAWSGPISQLYITGDNTALLLAEGRVYRCDLEELTAQADDTALTVAGFIPTAYGTVYAEGELGNYTLYADDAQIASGVTTYYTEDGYLIIRQDAEDRQAALSDLFGGGSASFSAYSLHEGEAQTTGLTAYGLDDDGLCPDCAAALEAYLAGETDEPVLTTHSTRATYSLELTESQQNIVKRARQQLYIEWTPLANITGWRGNNIYEAGVTYQGLPYAQPVSRGAYTPWEASLSDFAAAVADPTSLMYTSSSANGSAIAPYYGTDCSGFVSYALDLPVRTSTASFPAYADMITQSIYSVQVGDVFNNASSHNLIVTAVEYYEDGTLAAIETMEQTNPLGHHYRYGEGGAAGSLTDLVNRTLNSGFVLYRSKTVDSVSYTPDPAVNVDDYDLAGGAYTISVTASAGGTVSPEGTVYVAEGESQTFTFTPSQGYEVGEVLINGVSVGAPLSYTLSGVEEDYTVHAEFVLTGNPFADVQEDDWYYDAVLLVYERGLFTGLTETTFGPEESITRGQFMTVLGRMAGVDTSAYTYSGVVNGDDVSFRSGVGRDSARKGYVHSGTAVEVIEGVSHTDGYVWYKVLLDGETGYIRSDYVTLTDGFSDVALTAYYAPYIKWASDLGIVSGYGDGTFGPADTLNREQLCKILYYFCDKHGYDLPQTEAGIALTDADSISSWAVEPVEALNRAGILPDLGTGLGPKADAERGYTAYAMAGLITILD